MALHDTAVPLWRAQVEDVLITGELRYRIPKDSSQAAKARAKGKFLKELAAKDASGLEFLQSLGRAAREICQAGAAGVSVVVQPPQGAPSFRWITTAGALAGNAGCSVPRDWSASGVTLERRSPQLFLYPGRCFHYLDELKPAIVEVLVVPIFVHDSPWGTLWVVSHEEHSHFDQTDVEAMSSLVEYVSSRLARLASAVSA
jgi:GAF domain-containing protein